MPETIKEQHIQRLRNSRFYIQRATDSWLLRNQVEYLKKCVQAISDSYIGDIQKTAKTTLDKIQKFELYDVTRFELCRWVQTLICELHQT